jgi:Na+-translocating ferredoxin:NAD+ oxidoreductase RnfD subunit
MAVQEEPARQEPPARTEAKERFRRLGRRVQRLLSPVLLLVLCLIALAAIGTALLGVQNVLAQLLLFPAAAAATDLSLGALRYRKLRVPWSGIATGLFLAILIPPAGTGPLPGQPNLLLAGALAASLATVAKHLLRLRGRPWFNPAALAMLFLATAFRITPAWWGAIDLGAVLLLGILLAARTPRRATLPLSFFATYAALLLVQRYLVLGISDPGVLLLSVADPSVLFFALFMAVEPRSAPSDARLLLPYGAAMGIVAVLTGYFTGSAFSLLSTESLFVALLAGNLLSLLFRATLPSPNSKARTSRAARSPTSRSRRADHWGWSEQSGVALCALLLLAATVGSVSPAALPGPPPTQVKVASCTQDNRSIPATTLSALHQRLGPSVIYSYDSASGVTVFYDPVNHVTVYETDLFEDYGAAEFNGDDAIIAQGCTTTTAGSATGS